MKKMFLVAVMALGTASVFASSQPVQKNSVKESPLFCCTVMISLPREPGQPQQWIQSVACSTVSHEDACDKAYRAGREQIPREEMPRR
jgi:hypothetical protein